MDNNNIAFRDSVVTENRENINEYTDVALNNVSLFYHLIISFRSHKVIVCMIILIKIVFNTQRVKI